MDRSDTRGRSTGSGTPARHFAWGSTASQPDLMPLFRSRMTLVAGIVTACSIAGFALVKFGLPLEKDYHSALFISKVLALGLNAGLLLLLRSTRAQVSQPMLFLLSIAFFVWNTLAFAGLPNLIMGIGADVYNVVGLLILMRCIFIPCIPKVTAVAGLILWSLFLAPTAIGALVDPAVAAQFGDPVLMSNFIMGNFDIAIHLTVGLVAVHYFASLRTRAFKAEQAGNYRLKEKLGQGGMGEVYRARHAMMRRPTVVKMLRDDLGGSRTALKRFEREVRSASELTHPNTISIYDFGKTDTGQFYYAMEYLEGMDLQDFVEKFGRIEPSRALYILDQTLASLGEAHQRHILHRDVKPSNIFLTERGGEYDFVKVLDFGLAKEVSSNGDASMGLTMDGSITGTPLYMAPERFYGDNGTDHRSDLYALGAVAYFLLAGQPVFDVKNPVQALVEHARTKPKALRALGVPVSEKLEQAILCSLEKDPTDRFGTAKEFRAALRSAPEWGHWGQLEAERWWQEHMPPTNERFSEADLAPVV